jgi:hypothetical protein
MASFDKQALSAAKELVNRNTLPNPEDQVRSQETFYSAFGWDGYIRIRQSSGLSVPPW